MFSKSQIEKYFMAEKQESLVFLALGIIALGLALVFFFYLKTNFYKGAAIPLAAIGLIQIVVGYTVYARSDNQRIGIVYAFDLNPDKLRQEELPRMKTVMKSFVVYRYVEIALLAIGLVLIFLYRSQPDKAFLLGIGLTLAIQSALMLGADYFAEQRGKVYTRGLEEFSTGKKAI